MIGNKEIVYEEDRSFGFEGSINKMTVRTDGTTYTYIDKSWKKRINEPGFEQDKLEYVVINEDGISREYCDDCRYFPPGRCRGSHYLGVSQHYSDKHAKAVMDKGTSEYNRLRVKIKEKLRS